MMWPRTISQGIHRERQASTQGVTERIKLHPHELGVHSFGRITFDGTRTGFPKELGDAYQTQTKEIQENAAKVLKAVDDHYQPKDLKDIEAQNAYLLGRGALETFLTRFSVPRPTEGESPMQLSMFEWASENGFHCEVDAIGNIAVVIPGRKGNETVDITNPANIGDIVMLHHHLDRVSVAKEGSGKHPNTEIVEVDTTTKEGSSDIWVHAKNDVTTLGADNGAGGAVMWQMAEYFAKSKKDHPTIILLATVGEEGETDGAQHVFGNNNTDTISFNNPNSLVAKLLPRVAYVVNNDMEADTPEPAVIIGSFGLELFQTKAELTPEPIDTALYDVIELSLKDLPGGHSGLYPDRPNAGIELLSRIEQTIGKPTENGWRFCSFTAGEKHNQLPQSAKVVLALPKGSALKDSLAPLSPIAPAEQPKEMLSEKSTQDAFGLLTEYASYQGARERFPYPPTGQDLYKRSLNIGAVSVTPHELHITASSRIGIEEKPGAGKAFKYYGPELTRIATKYHATVTQDEELDTWQLDPKSTLPSLAQKAYANLPRGLKQFGKLAVKVVTAGLEVAFFQKQKYLQTLKEIEQLVFAMHITDIHNPGEALNVSSMLMNTVLVKNFLEDLFAQMQTDKPPVYRRMS